MNLSSHNPGPQSGNRFVFGCLGAVLIHPLLFVLAFVKGFVLGSAQERVMSATGGSDSTEYFLEGGLNAMWNLGIYYLFVSFILIPGASLVGSAIAVVIGNQWPHSSTMIENFKSATPHDTQFLKKLSIWAASLYIVSFCLLNLLFQFGVVTSWDLMKYIFPGLYWGIWLTGSIAVFRRHQDWRLSVWLLGIALLLTLLSHWLPRATLLIASIASLLCLLSYPEKSQLCGKERTDVPTQQQKNLSGLSVFALGGFTFYMLICLYCLFWAVSLNSHGADWAPFMILVLGIWGIPVAGGITLLLYRRTGLRRWIERHPLMSTWGVWIAVVVEVCVCGISWIGAALT